MLGCLGFIHNLKIIARILREVVNREKLCGTSAVRWDASARWVAVRPLQDQRVLGPQTDFFYSFKGSFCLVFNKICSLVPSPV